MKVRVRYFSVLCAVCLGAEGVTLAQPPGGVDSDALLRIDVSSPRGTAGLVVDVADFSRDGHSHSYTWSLEGQTVLRDQWTGHDVAVLNSMSLSVRRWSQFDLSFSADAGAEEVQFSIHVGSLEFPLVSSDIASARARARFNVADMNSDGAMLRGVGSPGTGAYLANYRDAAGKGSGYGEQRDPYTGYRLVKDNVTAIEAACIFTLTAFDRVTVSSLYDFNPDPPNCVGDLDLSGEVDSVDLFSLLQNFGTAPATQAQGDTDGDADVDVHDLTRLINEYGNRCP
jgi:hypothetical protein